MRKRTRTIETQLSGDTLQIPSYQRMLAARPAVALTILHHPSIERVGDRALLPQLAGTERLPAEVSRLVPDLAPPGAVDGLPLATHFVSRRPIVLRALGEVIDLDASALGSARVAVDGQVVHGGTQIERARLAEGVVIELGTQAVLLLHQWEPQGRDAVTSDLGLVGASQAIDRVRHAIVRAAKHTGPVLVRGETGTGKELVARALHDASARRERAYVTVNMAAVPPTLAASELFGFTKGAFSGAQQTSVGLFGRAHEGTLFMDEIGDTPLDVQAALLRVMETGEVQQVGTDRAKYVDVRVVAATDADLEALVAQGRFRPPLRFRLASTEITLPPLRARRDDIGRLLVHFLRSELAELGRAEELTDLTPEGTSWVPARLVARLSRYTWPGNVRQLRNVARWLAGLDHRAHPVDPDDPALAGLLIGEAVHAPVTAPGGAHAAQPPLAARLPAPGRAERRKSVVDLATHDELERLMEAHDFKLGAVAEALGVSRPALNDLIDAHPRLRRAQHLGREEIEAARAEHGTIDAMWRHLRVSEKSLKLRMSALGLL